MHYPNITPATFIRRPNRFIAEVLVDGAVEVVHVKNTGRCSVLVPGCQVWLTAPSSPGRKTRFDLVCVEYGDRLVNLDSQAPNKVVGEWLAGQGFSSVVPEYRFGSSRLDFYMTRGSTEYLMEVKGCTLEMDGVGYFPDAPTSRGVRHVQELTSAASMGYSPVLAFVIQMTGITEVRANADVDPAFSLVLDAAVSAGVKVLFLPCSVTPDGLSIVDPGVMW